MLVGQYNGPLKSVFPSCISLQGTKDSWLCSNLVSHTEPLPMCRTLSSGCQHPPSWGPRLLEVAAKSWLRATGSVFLPQILYLLWGWANSLSLPQLPDRLEEYPGVCRRLWKYKLWGVRCSASAPWKGTPASVTDPRQLCIPWKSQKKHLLAPEIDYIVPQRV